MLKRIWIWLLLAACAAGQQLKYARVGNTQDATAPFTAGYELMGGGKDLDVAFQWLCGHAQGGDLLVLRHSGDDDYNPYIQKLCKLNSVATVVIPSRAAAMEPKVAEEIRKAEAIFISGGDQATYWNDWGGTPVQDALNERVVSGHPLGGTSAGLAVMGEWTYTARGDKPDGPDLTSKVALADCYGEQITVDHEFLRISALKGIITDTHFAKRDRMGRTLVFLARIAKQTGKPARAIAVDERSSFAMDPDGNGMVIGNAPVYFIEARHPADVCAKAQPLTMQGVRVQKLTPGMHFNVAKWTGEKAAEYELEVNAGVMNSTQAGGSIY
ncbi:MAG: hypothetical protein NVS9B15_23840 [Acidobacteriaceae bacterium]